MLVKVLGSSAGGGFPQWNCSCNNCISIRKGQFIGKSRTQSQLAISGDGVDWFLLNASPDLRSQIESCSVLHPKAGVRNSPIKGVVLTNADLDHTLGLLLLRELHTLRLYCTASVRKILFEDNSMFRMLLRRPNQTLFNEIVPQTPFELMGSNGKKSGIICYPMSLPATQYPKYVSSKRSRELVPSEAVIGLKITDEISQKSFFYIPGVAAITSELLAMLKSVDLIFFDGTFWSNDELKKIDAHAKTAIEMGHVPLSGTDGVLNLLESVNGPQKIFIHINNTNPMLDETSTAFIEVKHAGWQVGCDGMEFNL